MATRARPAVPPVARDVLLLAVASAAMLADSEISRYGSGISVLGVAAVAATVLPLLSRRQAPLRVLGLVLLGVVACLATLEPGNTVILPAMIALYAVARYGDRRRSILAGSFILPFVGSAVMITSPHGLLSSDAIKNIALALLALAVGDTVRSRCAAQAAEDERRRQAGLEAEHDAERRVAQERLRIAREVHDVVAHAMVAINVQAGVAAHVLDQRPEQVRSALTEIKRVSGEALSDLRATLGLLREDGVGAPVRPTEGLAHLPDLVTPLRAAGIGVEVDLEVGEAVVPVPVQAAAYRIVQEALTNVLRHAGAQQVQVSVGVDSGALHVAVRDDGAAVPAVGGPPPAGSGLGLRGLVERAEAVGGTLQAGPTAAGGWGVAATLPLP